MGDADPDLMEDGVVTDLDSEEETDDEEERAMWRRRMLGKMMSRLRQVIITRNGWCALFVYTSGFH